MLYKYSLLTLAITVLFASCTSQQEFKNPLDKVLASNKMAIQRVMDSLDRYEVQIRYTQIDRQNDSVILRDYDYQVDYRNYFYPASTVKLPIAVLALEKLNALDSLDMHTRFYVEGDSVETTFGESISAIFAISDNAANNRLMEFLGQDAINSRLRDKNISPVRISHRLSTADADDITTRPLIFYLNDSTVATTTPIISTTPEALELNGIRKGVGFYDNDSLHHDPFDFSLKNYFPVQAQHGLLKRIFFPDNFTEGEQFRLTPTQRDFLLEAMSLVPRKAGYNASTYYDSYGKFFMYGDTKETIPEHIKIYNKVGYAYGTLTDCAYVVDTKNEVEFIVTATILVNNDGVFNDDAYEYDAVGIPFLAELGREIYDLELQRKK